MVRSVGGWFSDNEVDGMAFLHLTESDVIAMFPGKVGTSRKMIMLLQTLSQRQPQVLNWVFLIYSIYINMLFVYLLISLISQL